MSNNNVIKIHGKDYMTVAGRLELAREDVQSIVTEVIPDHGLVVVKATVTTKKGVFTGISAANPSKAIEKMSPYEVAETSAVGRALGFAGYGAVDSVASADEMIKATTTDIKELPPDLNQAPKEAIRINPHVEKAIGKPCPDCNEGTIILNPKTNKLFCDHKCWLNPKKDEVENEYGFPPETELI